MKFLITGASGFVGKSLCATLLSHEHEVVAAVRSSSTYIENTEMITVGNIDGNTDWENALIGVDLIIHLAARVHVIDETAADPLAEFRQTNVEGTLNLAKQAAKSGIKRFIFISTIGVNGNSTNFGHPFTEDDKPQPHDPYSISKYEAEQGLLMLAKEKKMEVVIIRPPLIYGYGAPGNFKKLINVLQKNIPLPFGAVYNKRSFVFVGNLVNFIFRCIDHPEVANQVFLISDERDLSTTELLLGCARALGVKATLLPVPQMLLEVCASLIGKKALAQRLCGNLQVDITKARMLLDWAPPITVEEGLKATAMGFNKVDK